MSGERPRAAARRCGFFAGLLAGLLLVGGAIPAEPPTAASIQMPPAIVGVDVPPFPAGAWEGTLRVRGSGFRPDSRIWLAGTPTETRYRGPEELEGVLPAELLASTDQLPVVVVTPDPGGGTSNPWVLRVEAPPPPPPPPGRFVVFTSNRREERNHIFLFDRTTGRLDPMPEANSVGGNDAYPSISADGRIIVFQSDRRGQSDVFLFDREARQLDPLPEANSPTAFDGFPAISADGRVLVFESDRAGGKPKIFLFDRSSRTRIELTGANQGEADDGLAAVSN
ncbi:MAG: hypothetical protein WC713_14390 [Candidatus Methylomirabilota bacterium]